MAGKTKRPSLYYIGEWGLSCQPINPSTDDIQAIADYINTHGDAARLPNIAQLAAFVLVAGDSHTGERIFGYADLPLLNRRPFAIIQNTLIAIGDGVADKVNQLLFSEVKDNGKRTTKSTSKQRGRTKTVSS
jgi:hypothetical protein